MLRKAFIYMIKKYHKLIQNRAVSQKKISNADGGKAALNIIVDHINYFNSLPYDTTIIGNHLLSEWVILNEFKDFIVPKSVRYESGNLQFVDLLYRKVVKFQPNFSAYNNALEQFRGMFKKDASSDYTPLDNLRVDKSFEDVRSRIYFVETEEIEYEVQDPKDEKKLIKKTKTQEKTFCRYIAESYIPLRLENVFDPFVHEHYFNANVSTVVEDYINQIRFN